MSTEQAILLVEGSDDELSRLSGLEVLAALRADERTKQLPIVILTSSTEDRDRLAAYEHYANSYVRKPVDYDQFVAAARQLGLYWVVSNVRPRSERDDPIEKGREPVAKILMLVSSAKVIRLADDTPHPTGYFVEEAIKPYDRFIAAGAEVVVATSDGQTPHPDPYGQAVLRRWIGVWAPRVDEAVAGLAPLFANIPERARSEAETRDGARAARAALLAELGIGNR